MSTSANSQFGYSSPPDGTADNFNRGLDGVEELGEFARGIWHLLLFGEDEPRQRDTVGVDCLTTHLRSWQFTVV